MLPSVLSTMRTATPGALCLRLALLACTAVCADCFRAAVLRERVKEAASCSIDHGLEFHSSSIDEVDWSEVECVKRSDSGNSGGVYFVQTPTQLVVVKPRFEPGMAVASQLAASSPVSTSMPPIRTPRFRVISEEADEDEWASFEEGVKKKMSAASFDAEFWYGRRVEVLKDLKGWEADQRQGVRPAVMEYVKTSPAVATMADILTPELWCDLSVETGCFCPAAFDKSLKTSSPATNCAMCAEQVAAQLASQPPELQLVNYLRSTWVEEVCALSALDTFIMEHDQMPLLRNGSFLWQAENILLSELHAVSIDASFLHGGIPVLSKEQDPSDEQKFALSWTRDGKRKRVRVPLYHRLGNRADRTDSKGTNPRPDLYLPSVSILVQGVHGPQSEDYVKFKGKMLTMLVHPASMFEAPRWKKQCQLEQEDAHKAPLGGDRASQFIQRASDGHVSEDALWNRCRSSMLSEYRFLARLDLKEALGSVLDQFGDAYCSRAGEDEEIECTTQEEYLEFILFRQNLLRAQLR